VKILFLTSQCSTPLRPGQGPGNARILRALQKLAECRVVIPVDTSASLLAPFLPGRKPANDIPLVETDPSGSMVLHPRSFHIPGMLRSLNAALFGLSLAPTFRAQVKSFRPDVILTPWAYPDGTAVVALGKLWGVPVVVRAMGSDINHSARQPGRRTQVRWALNQAGGVVAVSQALATTMAELGVARERISVIPTGVDHTIFHPRDRGQARLLLGFPQASVVVVAARLSAEKGLMDLLQAMKSANADVPFHLVLVGEGRERQTLEDEVKRRGLGDRVRFDGFQMESRMPLYYSAADLVCLPSHREGWPDCLMESFACGCPVVATRVGGVPEMLALSGAGLLVPPGQPTELAIALKQGLLRTWNRDEIARAVSPYTLEDTARRYLEVCERAVESARRH
jgi:glycosyltransferase involved in cell wall biosynthesis